MKILPLFLIGTCASAFEAARELQNLSDPCTLEYISYTRLLDDHNDSNRDLGSFVDDDVEDEVACEFDDLSVPIRFHSHEQKLQVLKMFDDDVIFSGLTVLKTDNISYDLQAQEIVFPADLNTLTFETPNEDRRRLTSGGVTGRKPILVVRVEDAQGKQPPKTAQQLSDDIFGTNNDAVNLKSQMYDCSYGKLDIHNEYDVAVDAPGVINVKINVNLDGSTQNTIRNAISDAVKVKLRLTSLPGPFHQIMYIVENCYGEGCGFAAYAYINSWMSLYRAAYASMVGVQMHELGHNFGLAHSGGLNRQTYTDHTCLMGNPLYSDEVGRMCFNPAKNFQLGWYSDKVNIVDITRPAFVHDQTLVGIANYQSAGQHNVVIKLETNAANDLFVGFNRATGINSQNDEADNEVTVVQVNNGNGVSYSQSFLLATLKQGESYTFAGTSPVTTIQALNIDLTTNPGTVPERDHPDRARQV